MNAERLTFLIGHLQQAGAGFANNCVMKSELQEALLELQNYRERLGINRSIFVCQACADAGYAWDSPTEAGTCYECGKPL